MEYCIAENVTGENIGDFGELMAIRQSFLLLIQTVEFANVFSRQCFQVSHQCFLLYGIYMQVCYYLLYYVLLLIGIAFDNTCCRSVDVLHYC